MQASFPAILIFLLFVGSVLWLSFYLGRRAKSASGYFAAHGQVGWFINGVAFAGDYLSAASFLGICGMIAYYGYDGFLYSIGFLAGWVVALFVIAEPIKRLGKYTFADALNSKFNSKGITFAAAVSTLVVSVFYLIPQMVGAGSLLKALLGLSTRNWNGLDLNQAIGVIIVGGIVITIVVTAGMVSTTWVQFIKGSMLVIFCAGLVIAILHRGINVATTSSKISDVPTTPRQVISLPGDRLETGSLSPTQFISTLSHSEILSWKQDAVTKKWSSSTVKGSDLLVAGSNPLFKGIRSPNVRDRLDFISLMAALFCGTAALPHILIRYYTVKDSAAARKSTVTGIIAIGFFYILTLYIGLGALVSGHLHPTDTNMAAPLLAQTFGEWPFAIISAIAFTTVLGTVSGLILAAAGAVAHDLVETFMGHQLEDRQKVFVAKTAAVVTGIVAVILGVICQKFNVSFLVGWAFNVAASANLPALVMLLFWRGTTRQGMIAGILIGLASSLAWLMLSAPAYQYVYNADPAHAIAPFSQPGLITIPLGFVVLILVSFVTRAKAAR